MLITGPTKIAEIPVPAGCEQVPAVGTGTGIQDITKTTAAMRPRSGLKLEFSFALFFMSKIPFIKNGSATKNHSPAHGNGRIPSEICIAKAASVKSREQKVESRKQKTSFFSIGLFMSISSLKMYRPR